MCSFKLTANGEGSTSKSAGKHEPSNRRSFYHMFAGRSALIHQSARGRRELNKRRERWLSPIANAEQASEDARDATQLRPLPSLLKFGWILLSRRLFSRFLSFPIPLHRSSTAPRPPSTSPRSCSSFTPSCCPRRAPCWAAESSRMGVGSPIGAAPPWPVPRRRAARALLRRRRPSFHA